MRNAKKIPISSTDVLMLTGNDCLVCSTICEILEGLEVDGERRSILFTYVFLIPKLAGCYLKNKLIIDTFNVIERILTEFCFISCRVLIPRLEECLDRRATQNPYSHIKTVRMRTSGEANYVGRLMSFKVGERMLRGRGFSAPTIAGVTSDEDIEM